MSRCLILLLIFVAGQSRADECDQLPAPAVAIKRLESEVSLNTEYGYRTLTNLAEKVARPGSQVLGLTRGKALVQFSLTSPTVIDRSGRWECFSPQLTVTYGFAPLTVFVAREFPQGGCAYKEIYEHELRHVKVYQEHMAAIEKTLLDTLKARFETGAVWRGPVGQRRAQLQQELDGRWSKYAEREMARVELAQALVDTPEEYERVANSCGGEIKKRLTGGK